MSVAGTETNGLTLLSSRRPVHDVVQCTTNNINQKKCHHGPPNPPAPGGSNSTGECDRPTSRDRSRSLRFSDVTFIDENNKSFILLTILLCAAAQRALGQKVSFWSDSSCFFHGRFVETTRTDPSYSLISFLPRPPESSLWFSMISD